MSYFALMRGLFVLGIILLGHQFWPILTSFTTELTLLDSKLLGFIPFTVINTQFCQGAIFLFLALWLFIYTQGFVEELEITRCQSIGRGITCGCRWLIASITWFGLIVIEPVAVWFALQESALPKWLIWTLGCLLFWIALVIGWNYPSRVINSLLSNTEFRGKGHG